jgi:glycosyltransferase involved in cell wall biosynthesis
VSAFDRLTSVRQYRNLGRLRETLPRYFEEARFGTARDYLRLERRPMVSQGSVASSSTLAVSACPQDGPGLPVTIVIPCYNEEASIVFLSRALDEMIAGAERQYALRFILVDDRSSDDTLRLLRGTFSDSSCFTIVALPENRGVSGAIHAGIDAAETEIVCSMDADCSYDPLELLKMIPLLDDKTSLVTASPYHTDGAVLGVPGWRLFLSRGLSGIYRIFLRNKLATYTSCFRVYRRSAARRFKPQFGDFRGIVELLTLMDMAGEGIKEFPTTLQSRIFGYSKMKTIKTIRDHLRLLARMGYYRKLAQKMQNMGIE